MSSGERDSPDRAEELFHSLVDVPPEERERLLHEVCGEDMALLEDVQELLAADASADGFFERACCELERRAASALETGAQPAARGLQPGQTLGDFRLVREIGRGGMGIVWEARQLSLGRAVALKLLPPERLWSGSALERLRREAEALGRIGHPLVVAVHAIGEAEGIPSSPRSSSRAGGRWPTTYKRSGARPSFHATTTATRCGCSSVWPRRWRRRTGAASCTATSNRPTSCSRAMDGRASPTSAWRGSRASRDSRSRRTS